MTIFCLKAIHIIAMVAWFAGVFYMFRLFVYHVENQDKPEVIKVFQVMERRLYNVITLPAMVVTLIFGTVMLVMNPGYFNFHWIHVKLLAVLALVIYTFYLNYVRQRFLRGDIYLTSKQCRWRNEIPTPLLIIIVILASVRPF